MKKIGALVLSGLLSVSCLYAQKKVKSKKGNSVLWEVSGNGLTKPSYLFGTIHMICNEDYVQFHKMDSVYQLANQVAVEMDITNPAVQMELAQGLMVTDGKKMSEYFTLEAYSQLEKYVAEKMPGISLNMFESFHPAILISLLTQTSTGCDSIRSYDMEIIQRAKSDQKELIDLESASVQVNALKSMPIDDVIKSINELASGKENSSAMSEMKKLVKAYSNENLKDLNKVMNSSKMMDNQSSGVLLDDRNTAWIPKIEQMMKTDVTLITFGAAHLIGDNGVIALLKNKGYTVLPITK